MDMRQAVQVASSELAHNSISSHSAGGAPEKAQDKLEHGGLIWAF